jgi:D-glycero-D-manno-heptose 1,7-bisphosphate phosphatase
MNYNLFVVSNQPDISRGFIKKGVTEKINQFLYKRYPLKEISICPHDDYHNCNCRKPKPGMLFDLSKKWKVNLKKSFLIGDNWKDIEAGKSAGCKTILLDQFYNLNVKADFRIKNLESAVDLIKSIELYLE